VVAGVETCNLAGRGDLNCTGTYKVRGEGRVTRVHYEFHAVLLAASLLVRKLVSGPVCRQRHGARKCRWGSSVLDNLRGEIARARAYVPRQFQHAEPPPYSRCCGLCVSVSRSTAETVAKERTGPMAPTLEVTRTLSK
jgi:hypothetical protein